MFQETEVITRRRQGHGGGMQAGDSLLYSREENGLDLLQILFLLYDLFGSHFWPGGLFTPKDTGISSVFTARGTSSGELSLRHMPGHRIIYSALTI
jgi:hypothetical protein